MVNYPFKSTLVEKKKKFKKIESHSFLTPQNCDAVYKC